MAGTKRKRRTKHRGNAAGVVEARGRTGRRPEPGEKGAKLTSAQRREARMNRPPEWKGSFGRAAIAAALFFAAIVLLFGQPVSSAVILAVTMVPLYAVAGFYTDKWLYNRRMKKRQAAARS